MPLFLRILLLLCLLIAPPYSYAQFGENYVPIADIDPGGNTPLDGGRVRYFSTSGNTGNNCLSEAAACPISKMFTDRRGGDILLFRRGDVFSSDLRLQDSPNGSSGNYTTYGSYGTTSLSRPIFRPTNNPSNNIRRVHWQKIDRLILDRWQVIRFYEDSHDWVWTNSMLTNFARTCFAFRANKTVSPARIPHNYIFDRIRLNGCGVSAFPCQPGEGFEGYYISSNLASEFGTRNVKITRNHISRTSKEPINIKEESFDIEVSGTVIDEVDMCDDEGLISARLSDQNNANIRIFNNVLKNNSKPGLTLIGMALHKGITAYNNLIYNNEDMACVRLYDGGNSVFYHNTCYNNEKGFTSGTRNASIDARMKNNIGSDAVPDNINANANLFVDVAAQDFRLRAGSAAIDRYSNCRGVTHDILNVARPVNNLCDAGAFEAGAAAPPPPVDVVGETFYVATNGSDTTGVGSSAAPWRTVQKCINALGPEDTCIIRAGTYSERLIISGKQSTSSGAPIVIRGDTGATVTIQPPTGTALGIDFQNNSRYVTITNIILNANNVTSDAIDISGGTTDISLVNIEVMNVGRHCVDTAQNADRLFISESNIHNCGSQGVRLVGSDNIVTKSIIRNNGDAGVNIVASNTTPSDNVISENQIYDNATQGIWIQNGTTNRAWNNLIWDNNDGIAVVDGDGVGLYNNTIYSNTANGIIIGSATSGSAVRNNIMYNNGTNIANSGAGLALTNNLCNATGGGCTVSGNPLFTDAGADNFTLQAASPAINAGVGIVYFNDDFIGTIRPQGTAWDIGAYEYIPSVGTLPTVSITSPADGAIVDKTVTITATATDADGITSVQFYIDGSPFGTPATSPPYSVSWDTELRTSDGEKVYPNGVYSVSALATDTTGTTTLSDEISLSVGNDRGLVIKGGIIRGGTFQ